MVLPNNNKVIILVKLKDDAIVKRNSIRRSKLHRIMSYLEEGLFRNIEINDRYESKIKVVSKSFISSSIEEDRDWNSEMSKKAKERNRKLRDAEGITESAYHKVKEKQHFISVIKINVGVRIEYEMIDDSNLIANFSYFALDKIRSHFSRLDWKIMEIKEIFPFSRALYYETIKESKKNEDYSAKFSRLNEKVDKIAESNINLQERINQLNIEKAELLNEIELKEEKIKYINENRDKQERISMKIINENEKEQKSYSIILSKIIAELNNDYITKKKLIDIISKVNAEIEGIPESVIEYIKKRIKWMEFRV